MSGVVIRTGTGSVMTGEQLLPALYCGEFFAVHRTWNHDRRDDSRAWTVTHVPTGYGMAKYRTRTRALAVARALTRMRGIAWSFKDPQTLARRFHKKPVNPADKRIYMRLCRIVGTGRGR